MIAGFEAAWEFFGGVFAVVIPDNMAAIVDKANPPSLASTKHSSSTHKPVGSSSIPPGCVTEGQAPSGANRALRSQLVLCR